MYSGTCGYWAVLRADSKSAARSDRTWMNMLRRRCGGLEMNTASMMVSAEHDTDMRRYHASMLERP
jgi:hypothetical protein